MSSNLNLISQLYTGLVDILFPPFCQVCDTRLADEENVICSRCWGGLMPTHLGDWKNEVTHHANLDCVLTGWFLDEAFEQIIYNMKYREKRILAEEIGSRLAKMLREQVLGMSIDMIVPVPLHSARLRERGFNQSDVLGKKIADTLDIPYHSKLLVRKRNTKSQTSLSIDERKTNVSGAFLARDLGNHSRFVIVDDVLTTGATLSACAQALGHQGAEFVAAVTAGTPVIDAYC